MQATGSVFESDRGYRFAVLPEPGAKLVRIDVRYPVGSADDPPGKPGLAHLVEHLLFDIEYSVGDHKTSIATEIGALALSSNAYTAADHTTYVTLSLPKALEPILGLEVNRLFIGCGGLTKETFAREREVVLNELRERNVGSGDEIRRAIYAAGYPIGHPYRAIDTVESVAALQLEDVCSFLAGPYMRGKVSVIVSGAVDDATVRTAAGKMFGRVRPRTMTDRPAVPVVAPTSGVDRVRADIDEPYLIATWPLPPSNTRESHLLELALPFIAPRLETFAYMFQWGHTADATILGGDRAPVLAVSIALSSLSKSGDARSAVAKSVQHAARSMNQDADNRDALRWKDLWQHQAESLLARWESLDGRNALMGKFLDDGVALVGRIDELSKSSPGETRNIVEKWLSPDNAHYLILEPSGVSGAFRATSYQGGPEPHLIAIDGSQADRPLTLPLKTPHLQVEHYQMENGLDVVMWPHGNAPLVHGRLIVDSGSAHDPLGKEGMAQLAGASEVGADTLIFDARDLSTNVDRLVQNIALNLRAPGTEVTDNAKSYLKKSLQLKRFKERSSYFQALAVAVYGDHHPYARTSMTEDTIDNISLDSASKWARQHVVPKNSVLVLAGKFDPALVKRYVAYNADQVSAGVDSADVVAEPHRQQPFVAGASSHPTPTVEIDVEFAGGRGIDRDHAKRLVLGYVLESQLATLRSKQAVSYGFSASHESRRAGGLWKISGQVDASRAGEAATAITAILEHIRRSPESYRSDFVLARRRVVEGLLLAESDTSAMVDRLVERARFKLPDRFHDDLADQVAQLTLASFHEFVARELAIDRQVFGAFGNQDAVDQALSGARAMPSN